MPEQVTFETRVPKDRFRADDLFNRARGLHLYVVACICEREGLTMPDPGDGVITGFCDEHGSPCLKSDATHFGWTLNPTQESVGERLSPSDLAAVEMLVEAEDYDDPTECYRAYRWLPKLLADRNRWEAEAQAGTTAFAVTAEDERLITRIETAIGRAKPSTVAEWRYCATRFGVESGSAKGALLEAVREVWGPLMSIEVCYRDYGRVVVNAYHPGMHLARTFADEGAEALAAALEKAP